MTMQYQTMDQVIFVMSDIHPTRAQNQGYERAGLQYGHLWLKNELREPQAQRDLRE